MGHSTQVIVYRGLLLGLLLLPAVRYSSARPRRSPQSLSTFAKEKLSQTAFAISAVWPLMAGLQTPTVVQAMSSTTDASKKDMWYNPNNERIYDTKRKSFLPTVKVERLIENELNGKNQRVVVIGEIHSNPCHHRVEFDVIKAFFDAEEQATQRSNVVNNVDIMSNPASVNNKKYAIGLECFYRQHQAALDRYIFEHQNIKTLKEETDWDESWGYDLNYYAKILNFASKHQVRLLGLNIPYPIARYVGAVGIGNVDPKLKAMLPEVDVTDAEHKNRFLEAIGFNHGDDTMTTEAIDKMYTVQCLWEDYMSETAAIYLNNVPNSKLCVIAGVGHVRGRAGIPDRIAKRTNGLHPFVIVPEQVGWSTETGLPIIDEPLSSNDADWAWYTEQEIGVKLI